MRRRSWRGARSGQLLVGMGRRCTSNRRILRGTRCHQPTGSGRCADARADDVGLRRLRRRCRRVLPGFAKNASRTGVDRCGRGFDCNARGRRVSARSLRHHRCSPRSGCVQRLRGPFTPAAARRCAARAPRTSWGSTCVSGVWNSLGSCATDNASRTSTRAVPAYWGHRR